MNKVLCALPTEAHEEDVLRRSFQEAVLGFGAERALLLLVEAEEPLRLRKIHVHGLTPEEVRACEGGEPARGVSSSVIRAVVSKRELKLIENPLFLSDVDETPTRVGQNLSVLCAPVFDPIPQVVLAIMYFQNSGPNPDHAYRKGDAVWLEGYAWTVGQIFGPYLQGQRREHESNELLGGSKRPEGAPDLIGESAHTLNLRRDLHETYIPAAAAPDPDPVLILGEKGTGKDLVARYLHAHSGRRDRPFLVVNCAEITDELAPSRFFGHKKGSFTGATTDEPGFFRGAHTGFLFLDEIGELSRRAQATLLRVLESRTVVPVGETKEVRVDVQVVLATNRELDKAVGDGEIRADFLDRFRTQALRLEPLRERPRDIPVLTQHFIAYHQRRTRKKILGISQDAVRAMTSYAWPGNVRELARVCSLLVTRAKPGASIDCALFARCGFDLPAGQPNPKAGPALWTQHQMRPAVRAFERELILSRLEQHGGNVRAARESLGLPKTTFHRLAASLGIAMPG